jgi:hypothetical protein
VGRDYPCAVPNMYQTCEGLAHFKLASPNSIAVRENLSSSEVVDGRQRDRHILPSIET